jgi:hypothetical protein
VEWRFRPQEDFIGNDMRHAISCAAAASGMFLLALALFGDPAAYLRQALSGWQATTLFEGPSTAGHGDIANDAAMIRQMDALQSEVTKLRAALAEREQGRTGDTSAPPGPGRPRSDAGPAADQVAAVRDTVSPAPQVTPPPDTSDRARADTPRRLALEDAPLMAQPAPTATGARPRRWGANEGRRERARRGILSGSGQMQHAAASRWRKVAKFIRKIIGIT